MRLSLWLILILAFSVGMGCALIIRALHFEAAPVVHIDEPTTKILVATRTIPQNVEIIADFVAFREVPLSEVPQGTFSSFAQVYRRLSAYPIPAECPVCEDLLLPHTESFSQTAFIPVGSQLVNLDIVRVRHGEKVFSPQEPLPAILTADQHIDIRLVPRNVEQGRLAEMKNEVLRTHASQDPRNSGELILENVPIHHIQRRSIADSAGFSKDSLVLMLDKREAAKLTAAAKKGQIRILAHQYKQEIPPPMVVESVVEVAEQTESQDISPDIPAILEQPLRLPMERAIPAQHAQQDILIPSIFDTAVLPPAPVPVPDFALSPVEGTPQAIDRLDNALVSTSSEFGDDGKILIRNESPTVSFGTSLPVIISDQSIEQNSVLAGLSLSNEPGQEALTHPQPEAVIGSPRMNQAIKFLPPDSTVSIKEYPPSVVASRTESVPVLPSVAVQPIMPLIIPSPVELQKNAAPEYSPFDRRVYTVLPSEEWGENGERELATPPRLLKNPGSGK